MKVIFMGTPDFAVGTLKALIASEHEVAAVVTQPDKPKGRGKAMQYTPVKEVAVEAGIPVLQPVKVRDPQVVEELRAYQADVIVVVAFGQIIPKSILEMPKYGCINVHASLLPEYRGAAPIQWAVIDGKEKTGVTTMQMDEGLDTGDMLLVEEVALAENETGGSLFDKLCEVGADVLLKTLEELPKNTLVPKKQPKESPTPYAAMLTKEMGQINWDRSAAEIERLVRGLNPWPSAYTHLNGKTLKIWKASVKEGQAEEVQNGEIVNVTKKELLVKTGEGLLSLDEVQLEGKTRMPADAFLRGYAVEKGVLLK